MAAAQPLTKTLARVVAQVAAISGFTGRVNGGYTRWTDAQNLQTLVVALTSYTQGYAWFALTGLHSRGKLRDKIVVIEGEILIPCPLNTTSDENSLWELVDSAVTAIEDQTAYGNGEHAPSRVDADLAGIEQHGRGIARFTIQIEAPMP